MGVAAALASALVGLPDEALDMRPDDADADEWTIRQTIEHTLYWEKHSTDHLVNEQGLKPDSARATDR